MERSGLYSHIYTKNNHCTFGPNDKRSESSELSSCSLSFWIDPQARSSGLAPGRSFLPNIMVHKSLTSCTI